MSAGADLDFGLAKPGNGNIQLSQIEWPEVLRGYGPSVHAATEAMEAREKYFRG